MICVILVVLSLDLIRRIFAVVSSPPFVDLRSPGCLSLFFSHTRPAHLSHHHAAVRPLLLRHPGSVRTHDQPCRPCGDTPHSNTEKRRKTAATAVEGPAQPPLRRCLPAPPLLSFRPPLSFRRQSIHHSNHFDGDVARVDDSNARGWRSVFPVVRRAHAVATSQSGPSFPKRAAVCPSYIAPLFVHSSIPCLCVCVLLSLMCRCVSLASLVSAQQSSSTGGDAGASSTGDDGAASTLQVSAVLMAALAFVANKVANL